MIKEFDGEMLNRISIFENLDPMQIAKVANICEEESFKPGQFIFHESDMAEDMYIVAEGDVVFGHNLGTPREEKLGRMGPGDAFGELSLFDGLPRSMDAWADVNTRLLRIRKSRWDQLIHTDTVLGVNILESLTRTVSLRLRKTNWDFVLIKGKTASG